MQKNYKTLIVTTFFCENAGKEASSKFLFPIKYLVMGGIVVLVMIIVIVICIVLGSAATRKCQHST